MGLNDHFEHLLHLEEIRTGKKRESTNDHVHSISLYQQIREPFSITFDHLGDCAHCGHPQVTIREAKGEVIPVLNHLVDRYLDVCTCMTDDHIDKVVWLRALAKKLGIEAAIGPRENFL